MGRITVKEKEKMEILGLTIDPRGNWWSQHIQALASDARKRLGAIRRTSHMLDDKSIMRAYKAFVRSKIVEYGSLAYWGAAESHLKKLDRIQESTVAYSATLTLLYYPLHWKVEENKLPLDSPASCWTGKDVVWLAP